jgi:hypothetical protein
MSSIDPKAEGEKRKAKGESPKAFEAFAEEELTARQQESTPVNEQQYAFLYPPSPASCSPPSAFCTRRLPRGRGLRCRRAFWKSAARRSL